MLKEATDYLDSFKWCRQIVESYVGIAVPGVVAVFLSRIIPNQPDVDEWLWLIVGDLPPAYITTEDAPNPATALDAYIGAMEKWVDAARSGKPVDGLIPVNVPPTKEYADMLAKRLRLLDAEILSHYKEDLKA
jgi:hypothetical protein